MKREFTKKIRRHTYSMPQLRLQALIRSDRRTGNMEASQEMDLEGWEKAESDWREEWGGDYQSWVRVQNGEVGWPRSSLAEDCKAISFSDLALDLASDPRGYALFEGYERGACGLDNFLHVGGSQNIGAAFSFCVNGKTYTAFENPDDGYRSSMGLLVSREGNWCGTGIDPCALLPQFRRTGYGWEDEVVEDDPAGAGRFGRGKMSPNDKRAGHGDVLELIDPSSKLAVLTVGTSRSDDYYPSFIGYVSPNALSSAIRAGVAECLAFAEALKEEFEMKPQKSVSKKNRL